MSPALIDCGNGVLLERGLRCAMSDGVDLVSDHYYPDAPGPHPTLLMRQPYGRDIASTVVYAHPVWFARNGYHVVIQDVRGRGDSGGDFYPFRHEARDGAETIAWLHSHPRCNGRIGMYGFSYQGATQFLAASLAPDGLQCIAPGMAAHDLFHGWFYMNGALRLSSALGWGLQMLKADARRLQLREASDALESAWRNLPAQPHHTPYGAHPAIQHPALPGYVRDWISNNAPGDFWSAQDISESVANINVPALHISGWYDTYLHGTIAAWRALREHAATPHAHRHQYLLAGPWVHIPWGDTVADQDLGPRALFDTDLLLLRWFDHWLKDADCFTGQPLVRHFSLGENLWHGAEDVPTTEHSSTLTFFLSSEGRANSRKGDGTLSSSPPEENSPRDVFVYDPEVPVLSPAVPGPTSQSALELGNNLLVYTSAPFARRTHIFGSPRISLHATTSAPFADFTAKLVRVTRQGRAEFLCIGIARSTYLFAEKYSADAVHHWQFELEPTSVVFAPGDSLRLEIAGCAFPLFDRNPSTSVHPAQMDSWNWNRSTHAVLHDAAHPSTLHLPLAEAE